MILLNARLKGMVIVRSVVSQPCASGHNWTVWIVHDILISVFDSQFRALSDQLFGTSERHKLVRENVVYQVCHCCL